MKHIIYHYSNQKHDVLLTKNKQHREGIISLLKADIQDDKDAAKFNCDPPYNDSMSFFFDLVPVDLLVGKFPKNHPTWVKGKTLFIHFVDASSIQNCKFVVVETKTDISMNDNLWKDDDDEEYQKKYFKLRSELRKLEGNKGDSNKELLDAIDRYKGTTKKAYVDWLNNEHFKEENNHYAARVPHLMLYPKNGSISVNNIRKIELK